MQNNIFMERERIYQSFCDFVKSAGRKGERERGKGKGMRILHGEDYRTGRRTLSFIITARFFLSDLYFRLQLDFSTPIIIPAYKARQPRYPSLLISSITRAKQYLNKKSVKKRNGISVCFSFSVIFNCAIKKYYAPLVSKQYFFIYPRKDRRESKLKFTHSFPIL